MLPKAAELPEYATRSPPAFSVTDTEGSSLGIPMGFDCSANEILLEYQSNINSTRQQFRLTYDHQLVSAVCPNKTLVADCTRNRLAFRDLSPQGQAAADTWSMDRDGGITNVNCPNLKVSSIKDSITVLESNYFSLIHPTTGLVMGIEDQSTGCVDGMNIVLQNAEVGNPFQLFYLEDRSDEIISLACPNSIVSVSDVNACDSSNTTIQLKTRSKRAMMTRMKEGGDEIATTNAHDFGTFPSTEDEWVRSHARNSFPTKLPA
jgi:hypothetical protein